MPSHFCLTAVTMRHMQRIGRMMRMLAASGVLLAHMNICMAQETEDFNEGWQFAEGEENAWEEVRLPHDWTIFHALNESGEAESGFLPGSTGRYRKVFTVNKDEDSEYLLHFEGVYHRCTVYLNGEARAFHPYGYTPFTVDLTSGIKDGENTVEVAADTSEPSSRWYPGSGIYRDVTLRTESRTHIDDERLQIICGNVSGGSAETEIHVPVVRHDETGSVVLKARILDRYDNEIASEEEEIGLSDTVTDAVLSLKTDHVAQWDTENPYLYKVHLALYSEENLLDEAEETFGYRETAFDPDRGFFLNGKPIKLKGVCLHHDLGALGAAENISLWKQRLKMLKEMGCNAIRFTHNPASSALLDLCDEMGFLVIEEAFDTWTYSKNGNTADYASCFEETVSQEHLVNLDPEWIWAQADIRSMVWAGRNHPCIIMWSIGNEILGNIGIEPYEYTWISDQLAWWVQDTDHLRPVTIGDNMTDGTHEIQNEMDAAVVRYGGVIGLNYASAEEADALHEAHPDYVFYGSETASELSSRGWYLKEGTDQKNLQVSAYDSEAVEWGDSAERAWLNTITRDFIAGEFIWTGYDYLGEPEPWNGMSPGSVSGQGPVPKSSYFGVIDTAGIPKDSYWFYQSQWRDDLNVMHILPVWNKEEIPVSLTGKTKVSVYTNAPEAELFVNGKSMGRKRAEIHTTDAGYTWKTYDGSLYPSWDVSFREGVIKAVGYDENGNEITAVSGRSEIHTHAEAAALHFEEQRVRIQDSDDTVLLTVYAEDGEGNPVFNADQTITFRVEGEGEILACDNGDPTDTDSYGPQEDGSAQRKLFSGKASVMIRIPEGSSGMLAVRASADGLQEAVETIAYGSPQKHDVPLP